MDEAHTCTAVGKGKHLRFQLLQRLAEDTNRHMILLTATPHSGDDTAFHNLLSLLKPEFAGLQDGQAGSHNKLREDLARHFVQRRRKDIEEWQESGIFPKRMTTELTYALSGAWGTFFDHVQDYCTELAGRKEKESGQTARLIWYATLALLRCVASSPAAAERALTTRLTGTIEELEALADEERIYDGHDDNLTADDLEPAAGLDDAKRLQGLIDEARKLAGKKGDPKLKTLIKHLKGLLDEGFRP